MILCEKFISDDGKVPMDYKIYCFNGVPDVILVCKDRFSKNSHKASYLYYDQEWNFIPLNKGDDKLPVPKIPMPKNLEKMLEIAKVLSRVLFLLESICIISTDKFISEKSHCPPILVLMLI